MTVPRHSVPATRSVAGINKSQWQHKSTNSHCVTWRDQRVVVTGGVFWWYNLSLVFWMPSLLPVAETLNGRNLHYLGREACFAFCYRAGGIGALSAAAPGERDEPGRTTPPASRQSRTCRPRNHIDLSQQHTLVLRLSPLIRAAQLQKGKENKQGRLPWLEFPVSTPVPPLPMRPDAARFIAPPRPRAGRPVASRRRFEERPAGGRLLRPSPRPTTSDGAAEPKDRV